MEELLTERQNISALEQRVDELEKYKILWIWSQQPWTRGGKESGMQGCDNIWHLFCCLFICKKKKKKISEAIFSHNGLFSPGMGS